MKNLVLGALLAVASVSAGCSASTGGGTGDDGGGVGETTVHVTWNFEHFGDKSVRSCPTGFGTATVTSQVIDDSTYLPIGTKILDKFDCSAGAGTIVLPAADQYLVWVDIESDSGASLYAQTDEAYVDTTSPFTKTIDYTVFDDAGFFFLRWNLVDATSNAPLSCADAGLNGSSGAVEASATVAGGTNLFSDKFTCSDHYGATDPVLAGTYTVAVAATVNDTAIGASTTLTNKVIQAPNRLTDLGLVQIPID